MGCVNRVQEDSVVTQPIINRPISPLAWLLILALSFLWGGSYFFAGVAVAELPPLTIATLRVGLAMLLLHALLPILGIAMPTSLRVWGAFLGMGILNNAIPFSLIVWGQTQIGSGLASIMNATTPVFGVLVAHALTSDEKLTRAKAVGVMCGFAGIVVLIGADALSGIGGDTAWPLLACAGAALSYAFAGVFGRRFARMGLEPLQTATGQLTCSSMILLPIALYFEQPWTLPMVSTGVVGAIIGVAVLSTALAYFIYFRVLALAGATNLLLVTFILPPVAIGLGVLVLGEVLLPSHVAGLALILVGLAAIDGRVLRVLDGKRKGRGHS
jgi:drug/metabolite transporter (DMT)-like permease